MARSERSRLFTKRGRVSTPDAEQPTLPSPEVARFSTGMSVTDTERAGDAQPILTSMLSVPNITQIFSETTVWQMNLIGYVECGSPKITAREWAQTPLTSEHLRKLDTLAAGRNVDREAVIVQIAAWLAACSDPRMYEPLANVIAFYLDNYYIG